ncbi:cytochrome P450 2K4-like isoform X3 [Cyprinodon tularosa]|uniref:cytochrome P450 2K4-like isoform X3 n=1 Tax=Cyprinodon tularosa TaxID=77115 RepID=UPI0018E1F13A|nr:cytochrome P450 2K4-like isoform X3 [Cyprinodon tularosa]
MEILKSLLHALNSVTMLDLFFVLLVMYLIYSVIFFSKGNSKEPPGPIPLPLLGNLLQLDLNRPFYTLLEFSKKYGSVFTVYFGPKKVVVLAGYRTVKDALVNHDEVFGERDALQIMQELNKGHGRKRKKDKAHISRTLSSYSLIYILGLLWTNGDTWREMRRFTLSNLRDFGMGKKVCEGKITEECLHLIELLKDYKGKPFDTSQPITFAAANMICLMVYGSRFEYDDPEFKCMVHRISKMNNLFGSTSLQESGINDSPFNNENLLMMTTNLFNAGTETTATTLRWGLLLMAKYPKIQEQVHEELRKVIGDRQVQVADRRSLPFTDAVIHETQRLVNVIPAGLPHKTSRDITFQGYLIKKGTTVYPLLTSVLHDPSEWEKPHSFHPAHFLDKEGKFVKRDAFMPFSAGRRICLAESLARMELFLFFTTLLQHFRFTPAPGVTEDELVLTVQGGLTFGPLPHKLCAVSRM